MAVRKVQYLVDAKGRQVAVVLGIKTYKQLVAELEELECLRAFDAAKTASGQEAQTISLETALKEIEGGLVSG